MPTAILKIDGDASGLARAFGDIRAQAKATENAIKSSMTAAFGASEKAAQRAEGAYRRSGNTARNESARAAATAERDAQRTLTAILRSEDQKRRAASLTAKARERAEHEATRIASDEARKRGLTAEQEARLRQSALERITRTVETEERKQTAARERESRKRDRAARDIGIGLRRGLNVGGDAALNVARQAHSQIQDARRQRADTEHTLNAAFFQAGVDGGEATSMRARLEREVSSGSLRGLSLQDVAGGILTAQTHFSVLSQGVGDGMTPAQASSVRSANLERQIRLAAFARNTYQDPSEVLRVAGMLTQQGVSGDDQMAVIRSMTGMAQAGSIELGNVTREALGPLMQNIARSTSSSMTPAQRSAAVQSAALETMAVGEVTARAGGRSRDMLNALAKTRASITSERTQESLYARLQGAGPEGRTLASQMFEMRNGRARLTQGTSAVGMLSSLVAGFGGDVNRVTNLVGAGGPGAPMVLDAQQRRLLLLLASQGSGGMTIAQNVASMQREGARFGAADVARGAALVGGEQRTELQSAEESRLTALTDNTSAMVQLSNALNSFATRNPITSSALQSGGGLLGGALGGALFPRAGGAILSAGGALTAARAAGLAALSGSGGIGATLAGSVGAASAGTIGATVAASAAAGLGAGTLLNRAIYSDANQKQGQAPAYTNAFTADFWRGFTTSVQQAVRDGFSSATVTAAVSPVDATHAAAQAPVAR